MHRESCGCYSHDGFLTKAGYALVAQRRVDFPGEVDMGTLQRYLDSMGSVSGLRRDEDLYEFISDKDIDEQARRFHNGS